MLDSTSSPLPSRVVVPTSDGHEADPRVELWEERDGRRVLYCYSDVEHLHRLYRAGCPWAELDLDQVAAVRDHVQALLLDVAPVVVAPTTPRPAPAGAVPAVPGQRRA